MIAFFILADTETSDRYWADAHTVAEELGEADELPWIERRRAAAAWERGELERALVLFEEVLSRARERGERGDSEAEALHLLGDILRDLGRFDEAERALLDADAIFRELHGADVFVAANTHSLGDLALDRGNLAAALGLYRQSIDELRDRAPGQLAVCLAGIASVLADRKVDEDAATIWGAVCAAEKRLGFRILTAERRRYETRLARLETTSAWIAGRNLTLEQAAASIPSS